MWVYKSPISMHHLHILYAIHEILMNNNYTRNKGIYIFQSTYPNMYHCHILPFIFNVFNVININHWFLKIVKTEYKM